MTCYTGYLFWSHNILGNSNIYIIIITLTAHCPSHKIFDDHSVSSYEFTPLLHSNLWFASNSNKTLYYADRALPHHRHCLKFCT